jgi:hypothetical protein
MASLDRYNFTTTPALFRGLNRGGKPRKPKLLTAEYAEVAEESEPRSQGRELLENLGQEVFSLRSQRSLLFNVSYLQ